MKQPPVNLNAAINLTNTISPKDPASLSKFMQLCHHWQIATLEEVNRRIAVARRKNEPHRYE
jgi:hypothetical protein